MAALLYPRRRVLAVCGDGGFMMNAQELETAVRLQLDLVVLVLQDDAYGMIRWKQATDGFTDFGMTFGNPDFVSRALITRAVPGSRTPRGWCRRSSGLFRRAACNSSRSP
jgi:acetolactate synthase-1/2/3 large subunit